MVPRHQRDASLSATYVSMSDLESSTSDGVVTLLLRRPDKANALSSSLVEDLHGALDTALGHQPGLLVLLGDGRNFCAGFDFTGFEDLPVAELAWRFVRIEQLLQRLSHAPCATLALAQGGCFGAGADLVVACSTRVATPEARFRMPGWRFGLALGTRRLARCVGEASAMRLLEEAAVADAAMALKLGLIQEICSADAWQFRIAQVRAAAGILDADARLRLTQILTTDTRAVDMASLIESMSAGDLKSRIRRFRSAP